MSSLRGFGERHHAWLLPMLVLTWLVLACLILAAIRPDWLGLRETYKLTGIRPQGEHGLLVKLRKDERLPLSPETKFFGLPRPTILEDGRPLPYRINRPGTETISQLGYGRYRILNRQLIFSSSDNIPPSKSGRTYEVAIPTFPPNLPSSGGAWDASRGLGDITMAALLVLALLNTRAIAGLVSQKWRGGGIAPLPVSWTAVGAAAPLLALALAAHGTEPGNGFFAGSWSVFAWAFGIVCACALRKPWACALACAGYGVTLGVMTWQRFVWGEAPDDMMSIAGILPWSDASGYFKQAREMLYTGHMSFGFNGRLLHPILFSVWLAWSGCDLQIACMFEVALFALSLSLATRAVVARTGIFGAFVFVLMVLFYYQTHASMAVMSENLGLPLGLLVLPFLLRGGGPAGARGFWGALAVSALGTITRPGAVFAMGGPAMAILHCAWQKGRDRAHRLRLIAICLAGIGCLGGGAMLLNKAVNRIVLTKSTQAYGNFLYSAYGTVTNTSWSKGHELFGVDYAKGKRLILEAIKEHPETMVAGIARAYSGMFVSRIAFTHGRYSGYSGIFLLVTSLGLLTCLCHPRFARERWAVGFSFLGFLFSIPFAPPWDTGMRAYAVFLPTLALIAAYGGWALARFAGVGSRGPDESFEPGSTPALVVVAAILTLIAGAILWPRAGVPEGPEPLLLGGSTISVGGPSTRYPARVALSLADLQRRTTIFQELRSDTTFLKYARENTLIGFDWSAGVLRIIDGDHPGSGFTQTDRDKVYIQNSLFLKPPQP